MEGEHHTEALRLLISGWFLKEIVDFETLKNQGCLYPLIPLVTVFLTTESKRKKEKRDIEINVCHRGRQGRDRGKVGRKWGHWC